MDVNDCANAARFLAKQGKVDEKRLCIDGGSAGGKGPRIPLTPLVLWQERSSRQATCVCAGYTTLAALAFRRAHPS